MSLTIIQLQSFAINLKYVLVGKGLRHHPKQYFALMMDFSLTMRLARVEDQFLESAQGQFTYLSLVCPLLFFSAESKASVDLSLQRFKTVLTG